MLYQLAPSAVSLGLLVLLEAQTITIFFARVLTVAVFTALHAMQSRYSDGNSVCLSVCLSVRLSVCQTRAL